MGTIIADAEKTSQSLTFDALIDALDIAFKNGCDAPERHHHTIKRPNGSDATILLMPAWSLPSETPKYLGIKIVNVFPDNRLKNLPGLTSTYMLYDGETGQELAILDGNTITSYRTAATSALAARYLAREDASRLLIVGSGRIASLIPDAYRAVRPISDITVWNIDDKSAKKLIEQLNARGFKAKLAHDLAEAVKEADIVSAATLATCPLIKGAWLKVGTHVDLIGSFTPKMRESDNDVVKRAKIYVDTPEALLESGDLTQAFDDKIIDKNAILATLSDLAKGTFTPKRDRDTITLFKAVGSALADFAAAKLVYQNMQNNNKF